MGKLAEQLKKREPFESPHQEAVLNIARTADRMGNRLIRLLRDHDLTPSQYNVLRILRGEGKPLPCLEIASRLVQVVPAITGLINRLEAAGLVHRKRCDHDRRVVFIDLTDSGRERLTVLDDPVCEHHQALLGHMTAEELEQLSRLLEKAREPLEGEERPMCAEANNAAC